MWDLLGAQRPPDWMAEGLCAQTDPEAFFPDKGGSVRHGKRICDDCLVMAECLDYALEHDERFGIWGGLSERERRVLRKQRKRALTKQALTGEAPPVDPVSA
jgi:WhiB family redox-sensing transcriptional regulator